jgi:hypothetical protein
MKKYSLIPAMLLFSPLLFGQGLYNNGAKISIGSGVYANVSGTGGNFLNTTSGADGAVNLSGTLIVQGNLTNNVATSNFINTAITGSKVELRGSVLQTIGGSTEALFTFPDLMITNSSGGVVLAKEARVNGVFTMNSGLFSIGTNNLTLSATTTLSGTPSASSMVVASNTGQLRKEFSSAGSFTFPVGDNTGTPEYSPVTLNITAGAFGTGAYAGVNLVNAAYPDPSITGNYLNRYWNISQSGISGFTCNALFNYTLADVTGTENNIYSFLMNPAPITPYTATNVILHQLTASGLSSFGSYTGANGIKNLIMKMFTEGLYNGGGVMLKAQGIAGNQFAGTVADKITVELHDQANYLNVVATIPNVDLNTSGSATMPISLNYNGSYYLTVKHRNSIETVSATPIVFSGSSVSYDFSTSAAQAFGSNQKTIAGVNVVFGGDANGDGVVDALDLSQVENDANLFSGGYILTDLNGDGVVDALDLALAENNAINFVSTNHP